MPTPWTNPSSRATRSLRLRNSPLRTSICLYARCWPRRIRPAKATPTPKMAITSMRRLAPCENARGRAGTDRSRQPSVQARDRLIVCPLPRKLQRSARAVERAWDASRPGPNHPVLHRRSPVVSSFSLRARMGDSHGPTWCKAPVDTPGLRVRVPRGPRLSLPPSLYGKIPYNYGFALCSPLLYRYALQPRQAGVTLNPCHQWEPAKSGLLPNTRASLRSGSSYPGLGE